MRTPFAAKRKPRRLDQDEENSGGGDTSVDGETDADKGTFSNRNLRVCISDISNSSGLTHGVGSPSTVVRPASKSKKRSSLLRTSFDLGGTSMNDDDGDGAIETVFTPKKNSLSRQTLGKNALKKSLAPTVPAERLPHRYTEDRPSYSTDFLNELKSSTPSTPKDLRSQTDIIPAQSNELDLAAKFGSDLALRHDSAIPTNAEIKEKKERRARLAKEQEFISLDSDDQGEDGRDEGDDSESNDETALLPYSAAKAPKQAPSRLVRDDEDIAEGFDDFISDGRIALGRKAEREQKKRQKAEIRTLINDAEGGDNDDSSEDESEVERNAAYEAAQTRKGMDGLKKEDEGAKRKRPRTPPRITPLPTLGNILESLKEQIAANELHRMTGSRRLEEVKKELEDIEIRKVELQKLVNESAEKFAEMRRTQEGGVNGKQEVMDKEADDGEEDTATPGLGSGLGYAPERAGLGMGMTMAQRGLESLGDD